MDLKTEIELTRALDISIADIATGELRRLSSGLGRKETAEEIHLAFRSLSRLQEGDMPEYDAWDSLFYLVWYQPAHINLAYSLTSKMPEEKNPLRDGNGSLQVVDFGCGALAMQFGLALAASDTLQRRSKLPDLAIFSEDASEDMCRIGQLLWERFLDEIDNEGEYTELDALRQACHELEFTNEFDSSVTRWLTAVHVAYEENADIVGRELDSRVNSQKPDLIVVTANPNFIDTAYSPHTSLRKRYGKQQLSFAYPD